MGSECVMEAIGGLAALARIPCTYLRDKILACQHKKEMHMIHLQLMWLLQPSNCSLLSLPYLLYSSLLMALHSLAGVANLLCACFFYLLVALQQIKRRVRKRRSAMPD